MAETIDPVLQGQVSSETITDPLLRALYFGSEGTPGFYNQLQQAGANLIGTDVPLQGTAALDPLELQARQRAQAGLGQFQPFFDQQQGLVNEAIAQSRRAEQLQDPYFSRAEDQYGLGLSDTLSGIDQARGVMTGAVDQFGRRLGETESIDRGAVDQFGQRIGQVEGMQRGAVDRFGNRLSDVEARGETAAGRFGQDLFGIERGAARDVDAYGNRLTESEDLLRGSLGAYDPFMTQQFYNPYEDAVVQQTIDDVMKAGDKQDIAARAQAISTGGESAFGSRARLGADERREALGRGLGDALSGIRSRGFSEAQQTGMGEFDRQRQAERAAASGLGGFAGSRLGADQGLSNRFTTGAQSRLAADQGVIDLLGRTGQQQFAADQGLAGNLGQLGQQQLAAQQGLSSRLGQSGQQQLGALQGLAGNLQQYGQSSAAARSGLAGGLLGIGQQRGAGASGLGAQLAQYGGQMAGIGSNLEGLNRGQRSELVGLGATGRGIQDTQFGRQFAQQMGQQMRPLQTMQGIGSMLPGYQAASSQIDSTYGMAPDPSAQGLGAAFSAYAALQPPRAG